MDIEDAAVLEAKLKNSIIRDLFSQVVKNTKSSRNFYMNLHEDGIKMVFMESDKEVQIYVCLSREMFSSYNFNANDAVIIKFDIRDLQLIGLIFENPHITISLIFYQDWMNVKYENQFLGWTAYRIQALVQNQQPPEEVKNSNMMGNDDESHTKIAVQSLAQISNVLHTLTLEKVENFEISFKSVYSQIIITPLPDMIPSGSVADEADDVFTLNVIYKKTQLLNHVRFSLKKFKTSLSLFEKNKPLEISFYSNYAKYEEIEKQKKNITVILACLADG